MQVTDPDAGSGTISVTLGVPSGSGTLTALAGTGVSIAGSGTNQIVLTGTLADINAYLNSTPPNYVQVRDFNGTVNLTMTTNDGGNTGTGGALSDSDVIALIITPVSDITADTIAATEDTPISFNVLTGTNGATADSFENPAAVVSAVTQPPAGQGTVSFQADGTISYTPPANFNGTTSFSYTVTSGGVTETTTVTINVGAVNDAPVNTTPGSYAVNEDPDLQLTGLGVDDLDSGNASITTTLSVPTGSGLLNALDGLGVTVSGSGTRFNHAHGHGSGY